MAYIVVDGNGETYLFLKKPIRTEELIRRNDGSLFYHKSWKIEGVEDAEKDTVNNSRKNLREYYGYYMEWGSETLTGEKLTWEDEPIEI